jgi:drug/metabolite transporter (DMT)-like permease
VSGGERPWVGPALALSAALAFSLSVPAGKLLLRETPQFAVAGLMYSGAGLGLTVQRLVFRMTVGRKRRLRRQGAAGPRGRSDWAWLAGATLSGAVAAPLLILWGLKATPAATASLLLSFEAAFTALWAAGLFREHVAAHVWWAIVAITAGGIVLGLQSGGSWGFSVGALTVIAGCALWGLDDNLTRNIETLSSSEVARIKGLAGGAVNLALLWFSGGALPGRLWVLSALAVGALSYGLSLVLFVQALRHLGSARTSAYFGAGPFFATVISLLVFGSVPSLWLPLAASLMAAGTILMVSERHVHEHRHGDVTHTHRHVPDSEHRHSH